MARADGDARHHLRQRHGRRPPVDHLPRRHALLADGDARDHLGERHGRAAASVRLPRWHALRADGDPREVGVAGDDGVVGVGPRRQGKRRVRVERGQVRRLRGHLQKDIPHRLPVARVIKPQPSSDGRSDVFLRRWGGGRIRGGDVFGVFRAEGSGAEQVARDRGRDTFRTRMYPAATRAIF